MKNFRFQTEFGVTMRDPIWETRCGAGESSVTSQPLTLQYFAAAEEICQTLNSLTVTKKECWHFTFVNTWQVSETSVTQNVMLQMFWLGKVLVTSQLSSSRSSLIVNFPRECVISEPHSTTGDISEVFLTLSHDQFPHWNLIINCFRNCKFHKENAWYRKHVAPQVMSHKV